jgi:hypothetical protein
MSRKSSAMRLDNDSSSDFTTGFPPIIRVGPREVVYEIRLDSDDVRRAVVDDSRKDTVEGLLWRDIESENTLRGFRVRGWRIPG